jgi:dihydrolipoamide dehydrogenase
MATKEYDLVILGTGSAMNIVDSVLSRNPDASIAVIDKDTPGGICLTRGCIPSKILLYPAEIIRIIERAKEFGIEIDIKKIDFKKIMEMMRNYLNEEISNINQGLSHFSNIDYYREVASFIAPYILKVGEHILKSDKIFLCTGSKPFIPPIKHIRTVGYLTSDTILLAETLPRSILIVGGGYIAAEYGHFLSSMGSDVTIIGRNPQFLPQEEPEISIVAKRILAKNMKILVHHEVKEVKQTNQNKKLVAINRETDEKVVLEAEEILLAAGRIPNTDILHPEKGHINTDKKGWIIVDEYLQTSQANIWAMGDAIGVHLFKHVANYESYVVHQNAILRKREKINYQAIPHAVFTYPEIASVGLKEKDAIGKYGRDNVLIGFYRYEDTGKGIAMKVKDYFIKVVVERSTMRILGAHIIGPEASILIHEIINLMYTPTQSAQPILQGMHIHPSLSEVVERAFKSLMPLDKYHHVISDHCRL